MTTAKLVIGNKNYSSWSLRGWLALKQAGIEFEEVFINLGDIDHKKQLRRQSTSAKVPVLLHDGFEIWDSLAIIEYLAEIRPEAGLWPADRRARARARSISAEMHSGFLALRGAMPMNIRRSLKGKGRASGVDRDILRITEIWRDCLERVAGQGDFLFGGWSAADAMFTPVASRLRTYGVELDGTCQRYADALLGSAWFKEWEAEALNEPYIVPEDEIDMD
ncbi:MAG: glutathione S-transferase family protein [Rhizobiales bacterium]|nr:glutathione S-transferase family protein [Hyphomicrobiales bacterium]